MSGISKSLYAQSVTPRAAFFFYANGSHPGWTPTGMNEAFVLQPHMAPMEAIRKDIVIFRNMVLERASGNSHKATSFSVLGAGAPTSFDQTLADQVKSTTPLASLEISIGNTTGGGGVIPGLSQRGGQFLPGVKNPVTAYQRIAERVTVGAQPPSTGAPPMTTPPAVEQALLARKSLLDYLRDDVTTFKGRLGSAEKAKMDFYLDSLRTLERGIGGSIPGGGEIKPTASCSKGTAPDGMLSKDVHVNDMPDVNHLFLDTIAMAFACGVTRIASAMWGGGQSDEPVKIKDISMGNWHSVSHTNPAGAGGTMMIKMQAYMAEEFVYFVNKLKMYQDGPGRSLFDSSVVVLGTQNGTSTQVAFAKMDHDKHNSPLVIAGSAGGAWKTGRVVDCDNRAHNDVYINIANAFGMKVNTVGNASWCKGPMMTS